MKTFIECLDIAADRLGVPEAAIDIKFAHEDQHYELMQTAAELYAHLSNLHKPDVMESLPPETTGYLIYHNDKVNSILGVAMRCLSTEQLCVLRDCLIERTPSNEGGNAP